MILNNPMNATSITITMSTNITNIITSTTIMRGMNTATTMAVGTTNSTKNVRAVPAASGE